jgi:hypothetical protein
MMDITIMKITMIIIMGTATTTGAGITITAASMTTTGMSIATTATARR